MRKFPGTPICTCLPERNIHSLITSPVDLNHNRKIEIYIVIRITGTYGAKSGTPNWNPTIDLKPDGSINIYDVVRVMGICGTSH